MANLPPTVTLNSDDQHTLRLTPLHTFDLSLGFHLLQHGTLDEFNFRQYLFDFSRVRELRESGLAWLVIFARRASNNNRSVSLENCSTAIAKRCIAAGFALDEPSGLLVYAEASDHQNHTEEMGIARQELSVTCC